MNAPVLITAAAGQTGTRLIKLLRQRGIPVHGLVTRPESAEKIERLGATAFLGDMRDEAALRRAMQGAEKVYHIAPTLCYDERTVGRGVLNAALGEGVRHFVLHGVMAPYLANINYHKAKQDLTWDLYRSGMAYTVLLPTNFMQNISWTWPAIAAEGKWELPYDIDKKLTWVDLDDVAGAAAVVLAESGHELGTYELCGSDSFLSRREIARLMSDTLGQEIQAVVADADAYLEQYRARPFFEQKSDDELNQIREMFVDYDKHGMPAGNANVLSWLLKRPARSYRDFLRSLEASRRGSPASDLTSYGLPGGSPA